MSDMIEVFKDPSIMEAHLKVTMVNAHGQEEAGSDANGVFRDALSAFWSAFENSCTVGEDERIPVIRHDFQAPEWEGIARLLVKGFYQLNFFPVKLNRAFLIATLYGESEVSQQVLVDSFLAYLSRDERALVVHALNGTLEDEHRDEWLDFLDRFGCKRVPKPEQCRDTILEIAHKEQIQACQYIIDCWHEPFHSLKTAIFNTTELVNLLNRAIPTNKKVIDLLEVMPEPQNNGQRDAISYLKRYLRGLDNERLMKVLRFLTGANVICVDKINVTFTCLDGFERRPIAHTCAPSLELPSTYQNFPEFRQEMNNIIDSEFWEMDIA